MDYLKRATVRIESINAELEIRQLHGKAQAEVYDASKGSMWWKAAAITCKYGVPAWENDDVEAIGTRMTMEQLSEISEAVAALGADEKNSESTLSELSISS